MRARSSDALAAPRLCARSVAPLSVPAVIGRTNSCLKKRASPNSPCSCQQCTNHNTPARSNLSMHADGRTCGCRHLLMHLMGEGQSQSMEVSP